MRLQQVAPFVLGGVLLATSAPDVRADVQSAAKKTVYVSVADASGKPVTDLEPGEILLSEDGSRREVVEFRAATDPLSIALLVDTSGAAEKHVQDFRRALPTFVRRIHAGSQESAIMAMEFGQAASPMTSFTTKTLDLVKPLERLYPKRGEPSVLFEAIGESSRQLARRLSPRRAIVILNLEPAIEQSAWRPNQVLDELRESGASLWAVSLHDGDLVSTSRNVVLSVLAQNTGGSLERILAPSAIEPRLSEIADALLAQFEIVYFRPGSSETPKGVQVGIRRPGLTVRAPTWALK